MNAHLDAIAAGIIAAARAARPLVAVAAMKDQEAKDALKLLDAFLAGVDKVISPK